MEFFFIIHLFFKDFLKNIFLIGDRGVDEVHADRGSTQYWRESLPGRISHQSRPGLWICRFPLGTGAGRTVSTVYATWLRKIGQCIE